jgi:hypothetical protein
VKQDVMRRFWHGLVILFMAAVSLLLPPHSVAARLAWSHWRRRHQKRAQQCHISSARRALLSFTARQA